jgi:hypothetical protein
MPHGTALVEASNDLPVQVAVGVVQSAHVQRFKALVRRAGSHALCGIARGRPTPGCYGASRRLLIDAA